MDERKRIAVVDEGTPIAVYERTGPGNWVLVRYCDQTAPAPPYPHVERADVDRWLAEQLS